MKTGLAFIAMAVAAEAFVAPSSFSRRSLARTPYSSSLQMAEKSAALETFDSLEEGVAPAPAGGGFWFGSAGFWGEEDYRGFVDGYKSDNLLNGVYPIVDRVRETKILTATAESGLLSALEDAGLTLSEVEVLLPALEESGVLGFAANNLDVLINMFGFIAIEPAKLALPAVVSLVKALKGAGLLKLGNGDAPVSSKPVKVTKAPKAMKVAAAKVKSSPEVKQAASTVKAGLFKAQAAAPSKADVKAAPTAAKKAATQAAAKVKAAAPSQAQIKAELKGASKAASKAAANVKAAAPTPAQVKAELKGASKAASKAAAQVKAAAPSKAQVKAELKGASKAASKAAAQVKAAAPSKAQVRAEVKSAAKAVSKAVPKSAPSVIKGNIANIPKAL